MRHLRTSISVYALAALAAASQLGAQTRIRQPSTPAFTPAPTSTAPAGIPPTKTVPPTAAPLTNSGASVGSSVRANTTAFGQPTFDPYATSPSIPPNAASVPPTLPGASPALPPTFTPSPSTVTVPNYGTTTAPTWPSGTDPNAVVAPSATFPNTGYPSAYPQQPSVMFPTGVMPAWTQNWALPQAQEGRYMRLFQDLRLTHTWLYGGDGTQEMGVDETEVGTTINFPNFFWSGQPLHVSPVFAMSWWDGPETSFTDPNPFPTELPPRVYGTYLDFAWQPHITPQLSADLNVSVGVYSDYEGYTSDSVRIQGTALGVLALTPTTTLMAGATYLDRVDIKLLPAGGILYIPNPQTRWEIYFPRPKVAHYLTTVGNTDVWMFLNAEYGGGSWTIRREGADDRRMDMNDIRVGGGFEWTHQAGLRSFVELGYVFDRELVFASGAPQRHQLNDTMMIRGGIVY